MKPWRAHRCGLVYHAEYLPEGGVVWRVVRSKGKPVRFKSPEDAVSAAQDAYLAWVRQERAIFGTRDQTIEGKLEAEAESWLRSKRQDVKRSRTIHRPGKRPLRVMMGKA